MTVAEFDPVLTLTHQTFVYRSLESQLGLMPSNIGMKEAGALPKVALTSYKALVWHCDAPWTENDIGPTVLVLGMQSLIGPLFVDRLQY